MPQMAPLSWLSLFLFFILIFSLFIIMNYYSFLTQLDKINFNKKIKKINWKW